MSTSASHQKNFLLAINSKFVNTPWAEFSELLSIFLITFEPD